MRDRSSCSAGAMLGLLALLFGVAELAKARATFLGGVSKALAAAAKKGVTLSGLDPQQVAARLDAIAESLTAP